MADEVTSEPAPETTENSISEPNPAPVSPQEPVEQAPIPPTESVPIESLPEAPQTSPTPESVIPVKDHISANEPLNQPTETAQMAGNEPFDKIQNRPIDLAEEIKTKQREENLKLANETRQEKKRKKIDAILDLFAKQTNLTNDEVEKLLHVSDATATRYLEILEKEGKIKQVGKTGSGVKYEKI